MGEKLIPGLPETFEISLLQQTREFDDSSTPLAALPGESEKAAEKQTVLQTVLRSDESRNELTKKIKSKPLLTCKR